MFFHVFRTVFDDSQAKSKDLGRDSLGVETLENDEPLMDAGLDSLAAVEFANAISKDFVGLQMPGTLMPPGGFKYMSREISL